jgi:hypothetical protein
MFAFIHGSLGKRFREIANLRGLTNQQEFDRAVAAVKGTWGREPDPIGGWFQGWHFGTDNRHFGGGTYRLGMSATINTSDIGRLQGQGPVFRVDCTASHRVRATVTEEPPHLGEFRRFGRVELLERIAPATSRETGEDGPDFSRRNVRAAASYPFSRVAPNIDIDVQWHLRHDPASGRVHVMIRGTHNRFPFYEVLVNSQPLYQYRPPARGPGPINLTTALLFERTGSF